MGQDVFYMVICKMPSGEEMAAAREHINDDMKQY